MHGSRNFSLTLYLLRDQVGDLSDIENEGSPDELQKRGYLGKAGDVFLPVENSLDYLIRNFFAWCDEFHAAFGGSSQTVVPKVASSAVTAFRPVSISWWR